MRNFLSGLVSRVTKQSETPHKHVFDSINGVDHYGTLIVLHCSCGFGRVLSAKSEEAKYEK